MKLGIIWVIILIAIATAGGFFVADVAKDSTPAACTLEAKICPDGSAVGRSGPNCEFAACPDVSTELPADSTDPVDQGSITSFEECVAAGNPVMESYPRQCRSAGGGLFVEDIEDGAISIAGTLCEDSQRNVGACIEIYQPVCGLVEVRCITTPCNPVEQTFPSSCFACMNASTLSYTEGVCSFEQADAGE